MFKSKINVILTIHEDVKFDQPPSWFFFKGVNLGLRAKFLQSWYILKLDLQMIGKKKTSQWRERRLYVTTPSNKYDW